jgi:hypothetical protein
VAEDCQELLIYSTIQVLYVNPEVNWKEIASFEQMVNL